MRYRHIPTGIASSPFKVWRAVCMLKKLWKTLQAKFCRYFFLGFFFLSIIYLHLLLDHMYLHLNLPYIFCLLPVISTYLLMIWSNHTHWDNLFKTFTKLKRIACNEIYICIYRVLIDKTGWVRYFIILFICEK